ncbi:MAG: DUF11 domain-containing protein [Solirubrobacterales bacterium]
MTRLLDSSEITNKGQADYLSQTLGTALSEESNVVQTVVSAADMIIFKSHADPPPGGPVVFELLTGNSGSRATGGPITVTDSFPPAAFSSITITSADGWDCSATAGLNLSCTRSEPLDGGDLFPAIVVEASLVGSPPAFFANSAEVIWAGDPNPEDNVAVDYLPAPPATTDLQMSKSVSQSSVPTGDRVTWTITAYNAGPSEATGVQVIDTLPLGAATDVVASSSQGSCEVTETPEVICSIGSIGVGFPATITVTATVTAEDTPGITNVATVSGDQPDARPNNNTAEASFEAASTADIRVTKTADPSPMAGEPFSYTIEVTNDGPTVATGVVFNDQIPDLFTATEILFTDALGCSFEPGEPGGTLTCSLATPLTVGSTVSLTLAGTLSSASAGVPITNTVTAYSSKADPDPENNASSVTVTPLPFAEIAMSKTASSYSAKPGRAITWSFVVQNLGPLDADPVVLEDELPAGLAVVSLPDGCELDARDLSCDLGAMAPGDTRNLSLTVRATPSLAGQTVTNTASVSSPRPDPNSANNSDTSSVQISSAKTNLKLKQTVNRKKASSGGSFYFRLTVTNASSSTAYNSVVCQKLPPALRIVKAKGARIGPGRQVCWTIGRLDPDESRKFLVKTRGFSRKKISVKAPATLSGENVESEGQSKTVRIIPSAKPSPPPQPVAG